MYSTISSVKWSSIQRISIYSIQFFISIILARLLSPSDYGMVAMITIFIIVAQTFIESGFTQALIQKKNRTSTDYSTMFYFNIFISVIFYLLLALLSPIIADFYNQPALVPVIFVSGLSLIVGSFSIVQRAIISINLEFKKLAILSTISTVVSGTIGIKMAYGGFGYWSLVMMTLSGNLLDSILLSISSSWKPHFCFSKESFKSLFSFGSKLLGSNLIHQIYRNLYSLIIGKVFSAEALGLFNRAYTLSTMPTNIFTSTVARAVYPIECRMQDNNDLLSKRFLMYITMVSVLVFPLMAGIASVSDSLVTVLLTEKWLPCSMYIQIICIAFMFDPVMGMSADLLIVKHKGDYVLRTEIIKKVCAFTILFATIPFGITMMCWGLLLYSLCDMIIIFTYVKRVIPQINIISVARVLLPILLTTTCMYIVVYLTQLLSVASLVKLITGITTGIISYLLFGLIVMPQNIKSFFSMIKELV